MGRLRIRLVILVLSFVFCLNGCSVIRYYQQLKVLKRVGKSQKQIERYLNQQEDAFYVLLEDVKNGKLEPEILKEYIIKVYGPPVIERKVQGDPLIAEELLYRHPTQYFSSDRIYLYFDHAGRLVHWKHSPN